MSFQAVRARGDINYLYSGLIRPTQAARDYGIRAVIDLGRNGELEEKHNVFSGSSRVAYYHRNLFGDEPLPEEDDIAVNAGAANGGVPWDSVALDGQTLVQLVFFLDPIRANTGCLSMLPGTHFTPIRERMERWYGGVRARDGDFAAWPAAIAMESDPGDAVIFNIKVYHAAVGDSQDRRSININYVQKPRTPEQEEYLTSNYVSRNPFYTPELFQDATPKRMRMLSFLKEAVYDAR